MKNKDIVTELNFGNKEKLIHQLYEEYFSYIRKYIVSNGGSAEDAKDIFQETVIVFITKFSDFKDSPSNLKSLLLTIARNKWIDQKRKDKRLNYFDDLSVETSINKITHESTPLDNIHGKEKERAIETILSSLGERCKELLVNYIFYEMTMKEIADKMGFSNEDSAKTQHYKCRQKLIALYKDNEQLKMIFK